MDINNTLNEVLVRLFRDVNTIEERALKTGQFTDVTTNDVHVMEAIGIDGAKNMTSVAKSLGVTTGTLTIAVNSLVKKNYVSRVRSEEDRRVVLISLTERGEQAYMHHQAFHQKMIEACVGELSDEEQQVLAQSLGRLIKFFRSYD